MSVHLALFNRNKWQTQEQFPIVVSNQEGRDRDPYNPISWRVWYGS
jgi:hypothetical protein